MRKADSGLGVFFVGIFAGTASGVDGSTTSGVSPIIGVAGAMDGLGIALNGVDEDSAAAIELR